MRKNFRETEHRSGWIEVVCGVMFSGKSEELIRRVKRAAIARQQVQVFKPDIDNRYEPLFVNSHSGIKLQAISIKQSDNVLKFLEPETNVVAIDEIQFFEPDMVDIVEKLAGKGIRVILAGLELDFRGEPFGIMPQILCVAEYIDKLHAICVKCSAPATRTQRLINGRPANYNDPVIMVGASEAYEPRCRDCHIIIKSNVAQFTSLSA